MDKKAMYLCNGKKEDCRKKSADGELVCYRHSDGNEIAVCRHTSDIRYARNFKQIYGGFFYEKEDVPGNETPSADQTKLDRKERRGKAVEEIRKTKIKEAMKETGDVYEKLNLNMTEIEIATRCQNIAARVVMAEKQLETETEEVLEKKQTPMKTKIMKWMPAICSTLAIVLSVISLVLRLYR